MILYLDTSALVKRYVAELGTAEVSQAIAEAEVVGTSIITRAEMPAALAKAVRMQILDRDAADAALQVFRSEWPRLVRVQTTELLIARADALAWEWGLRGYDAAGRLCQLRRGLYSLAAPYQKVKASSLCHRQRVDAGLVREPPDRPGALWPDP